MNTSFPTLRPALSGIESLAFGIIGLAGLLSILFAATPMLGHQEQPRTTASQPSHSAPGVASSAAGNSLVPYPRAI